VAGESDVRGFAGEDFEEGHGVRAEGEMLASAHIPSEGRARVFAPADLDDRITCSACRNHTGRECSAWREVAAIRGYAPDTDLPRRCLGYRPGRDEQDQRSGRERWPTLDRKIEHKEARK
jgi:hypothetical protein